MAAEQRDNLKARLDAMPSERWRQINNLLDAVLDLPPHARTAYLKQHSSDDSALRDEVAALLASIDQAEGLLEEPAGVLAEPMLVPADVPSLEGKHIGVYRIVKKIGQGGMGAVYLAERDDVKKKVALKLVRDGLASPEHVQRFLFERRLLARLEHANIARLLDAGVTEQGTPYFVMEYIEGHPLDTYCDTQRLSVNERLRLFQTVCRVVQYAHQNLVVHRDLKPSNILVTDDGNLRLLDFGIAKLLEEDQEEQVLQTRTGMRLMTPAYASPEQLRGDPITTASDIYALGIILYELLTGQRPFDVSDSVNLDRAQGKSALKRPSTAVTEAFKKRRAETSTITEARATTLDKLRRRLSGDLDTICLKALRPEPERRYQSAEQFLEDIRRHLEGLPVSARKDTVSYRLIKFVRRHRLGVAAASLVLLSLLGGIIATARQSRIANQERDKAELVTSILPELFWGLEPGELQNTAVTPEEMLDRGLEQIDTKLSDQPEIQARVLTLATDLYMRLAAYQKAERVARRALALRQSHGAATPEDVAASMAMLAQSLDKQGRYEEAAPLHQTALSIRRAALGNKHLDMATGLHNYAMHLTDVGDYDEAEITYEEALTLRQALDAVPRELAYTQTNLATVYYYQGRYEEAERLCREALALRREALGNEHPDVANSLYNLASILRAKGEKDKLEGLFREALAIHRKSFGDTHPFTGYTLNTLALVLKEKEAFDEAEQMLEEAYTILAAAHDNEHEWVALVIHNQAFVQAGRGDYDAAEPLYRRAIAMYRKVSGAEHPEVASSLLELAQTLMKSDRPAAAEEPLREALAIFEGVFSHDHPRIAQTMSQLGACLTDLNRYDEAEPLLLESYRRLNDTSSANDTRTQTALRHLITFYEAQGLDTEAERYRAMLVEEKS